MQFSWALLPLKVCVPPYVKINSKWIKDLNARPKTIKRLEENRGSKLFDVSLSNIFLDMSPQSREIKSKYEQTGLHQTQKRLHSEGNY